MITRCSMCAGDKTCIAPNGPSPCDLVFIGEAPGFNENEKGKVFIGKTGEELNRGYLPICNLRRDRVLITNAIKCLPPGTGKLDAQRDKDLQLLRSCAETHLYRELEAAQPKLIIPMGSFACRAIDPDINLELQHGMPVQTAWGTAFPMYPPAGGIHEPKKMLQIRTDWVRLSKYLKNKLQIAVDPFAGREQYEHIDQPDGVRDLLRGKHQFPVALDTESTRKKAPFCLTFSTTPGTGYLIRADDFFTLSAFQEEISIWENLIFWHNWLYDIDPVRKMGLVLPRRLIKDTMVKAFHLGNVPQGLKALAYRELGMVMKDFDDVVTPHSRELVLDYYRQCASEEWLKPDEELRRDETGKWELYKPQGFGTKLRRFFTDYEKNPEKDPFKMWTDNWGALHEQVEERMGEWPGKCISHAPFKEVIHYACRDSDATIRLHPILHRMQTRMRKAPQEHWGDM